MPAVKITTTRVEQHEVNFTGAELRQALKTAGYDIPIDATISVAIPGGGDWSNTDLEIGNEHQLHVAWTVTEEKDG